MFAVIVSDETGKPTKVLLGFQTESDAGQYATRHLADTPWHVAPTEFPEVDSPGSFVQQLVAREPRMPHVRLIVALRKEYPTLGLREAKDIVEQVTGPAT